MVAVNTVDGIKYGFRLLGYLLAVGVAGFVLIMIGSAFTPGLRGGNPILMGLFWLAGALVWYAGALGMLYKVIGDGVEVGSIAARQGGTPAGGHQPPRQPPQGGNQGGRRAQQGQRANQEQANQQHANQQR